MDRSMEESREFMSVPAFGDWDKLPANPDYSLNFSKIRQNRKQSKSDYNRIQLDQEAELLSRSIATVAAVQPPAVHYQHPAPEEKKTFMCFFCCGRKLPS